MKKIVAISAGLSQPSSTRLLADRLGEASRQFLAGDGYEVSVEVVELRDLAQQITNNMLTGFPSGELATAIEHVTSADALIAVTPIFSASYSGLFKSFFDVIDPDALAGKPVLVAATGGSARHSLALEHALRPLFSYLHAVTVPTAVFAASEDWGSDGGREGDLVLRIGRAARELADAVERNDGTPSLSIVPGVSATSSEPADLAFVPFDQLLARQGIRP